MMLVAGTKLGAYEIVELLGAGGMGEVYRARDPKLGREVALKILPEAFARDAERMARLRREAQVLASLNHPHIAAVYGFEDSGAVHALVMEAVDGPTLAGRLAKGAIPLDEAMPVAKQICEALEYAHERGIVHRDLKPANIKVTASDAVKVLDFGLAKALENDPGSADISNSPTLSRMATQAGIILGTAAYMSPEQAKGKPVDRRTDIWAFGCVLYEMLTGAQAFTGETVTDVLAAVVRAEPDWSLLPANTPPRIRELLQRCFKKDARQRLQAIGDARITLDEFLSAAPGDSSFSTAGTVPPSARGFWQRSSFLWGIAGLLAGGAIGVGLWMAARKPAPSPLPVDLSLPMPANYSLRNDGTNIAVSPDSRLIAFAAIGGGGSSQIWVRQLDDFTPRPVSGTEGGESPFFSPDSEWLGFFVGNKLEKVPLSGGVPQVLCAGSVGTGSAVWASNGMIYFSGGLGVLMEVSGYGGQCRQIISPDASKGSIGFSQPRTLPDGNSLLVTVENGFGGLESSVALLSLKTLKLRTILRNAANPAYLAPGYLVFGRAGALWAVPFNVKNSQLAGPLAPVIDGIANNTGGTFNQFAVSENGVLVYAPGSDASPEREVVEVDRDGASKVVTPSSGAYEDLSLSPDGTRLAMTIEGQLWNIWTYDLARKTLARLSFANDNRDPFWTADGKGIAYTSLRNGRWGIYEKPADGNGPERQVFRSDEWTSVNSFSSDGRTLAVSEVDPLTGSEIWLLPLDGAGKPRSLLPNQTGDWFGQFSPDNRWIAYESNELGRSEIYVQSAAPGGGKWQISNGGGARPVWPRKDAEIFYRSGNELMAVPVQTGPGFSAGTPHALFHADYFNSGHDYDATADGRHFFFVKSLSEASAPTELRVVLNWTQGLVNRLRPGPPH